MRFVDGLPVGHENAWWQIVTPIETVRTGLDAIDLEGELFLDLKIIRDGKFHAHIRVIPDQELGIARDEQYRNRIRIERGTGLFLDQYDQMTDNFVGLRVVLSMVEAELSSGYMVLWPEITSLDQFLDAS